MRCRVADLLPVGDEDIQEAEEYYGYLAIKEAASLVVHVEQ